MSSFYIRSLIHHEEKLWKNLGHNIQKMEELQLELEILLHKHLKILLSVEHDTFGLHFSVFDINFVTAKDNWYIFTDAD